MEGLQELDTSEGGFKTQSLLGGSKRQKLAHTCTGYESGRGSSRHPHHQAEQPLGFSGQGGEADLAQDLRLAGTREEQRLETLACVNAQKLRSQNE